MGVAANAECVILFGSYARGEVTEHSDVDLMIISESDLPRFKRGRELYKLIKPYPFGMDLVVYTPEELEKGKLSEVSFVSTVLHEGKIAEMDKTSRILVKTDNKNKKIKRTRSRLGNTISKDASLLCICRVSPVIKGLPMIGKLFRRRFRRR